MSESYIYRAALYCEKCGGEIAAELKAEGVADNGDSDQFPQGPFPSYMMEGDSPDHCDACSVFLENPLTSDGREYVREALADYANGGRGRLDVLEAWSEFYGIPFPATAEDIGDRRYHERE